MYETVFENECTTIEEEKCEIQYMTQYEEECSTINEQVKIFIFTPLQILFCFRKLSNYSIIITCIYLSA